MTITVEGSWPKRALGFWPAIEQAIGALCGETDGKLTRINRPDGQCDYRAHGEYELTYITKWSEHQIKLILR